ncbi:hypothetical protein [Actinomycetospora aeridis]|uniref:Uncharacterized protein n=1 Tax=Actinomycetospora aeridis TaxID=3129231 RepID=A0ABU8NAI2_9PSEU
MDGQAHPMFGNRYDGAGEYLVVVVDTVGRFRDAYGPYALGAAHQEAERRRRALTEAGEHAADVRIARHHPVTVPRPRGPGARRREPYWMWRPLIARAMTSCWICSVPSKMS